MTAVPTHGLLLQLLDPANRADPYRICAQFRDSGPFPLAETNVAVFSRYRDCDEVLRHPSSSSDRSKATMTRRILESGAAPKPLGPPGFPGSTIPSAARVEKDYSIVMSKVISNSD